MSIVWDGVCAKCGYLITKCKCREEAAALERKMKYEEKEQVNSECPDFGCVFAGTYLCVADDCPKCDLKGCRGCRHLQECIDDESIKERCYYETNNR